jgi:RNA-directed DNA polymerase
MKTYKNLYSQVYDFANLSVAYRRARRGKRDRAALVGLEFEAERNLLCLQVELKVLCA